jgi:hypothetical protein
MSKKGSFFVVVALVAVLVLASVSSVFAQTGTGNQDQSTGNDPGNAMAPGRQWMTLNAGQQHFYAFRYSGDESNINVRVSADPQNAIEFAVWTPGQFRQWQGSENFEPIGRGTSNPDLENNLFWQGNFTFEGTYYVVVRNLSQARASYNLTIDGNGVSFAAQGQVSQQGQVTGAADQQGAAPSTLPVTGALLQTTTQVTATQTVTPTRAPAATTAAQTQLGTSPGNALTPTAQWVSATAGMRWYAFSYAGGSAQVSIRMQQRNNASCEFEVFTPESMTYWRTGGESSETTQDQQEMSWPQGRPTVDPVGRGTPNNDMGGDLFWTGNFEAGGTFYVLVTCNQAETAADVTGQPGFYLQIFGSGVTFLNGAAVPQEWNAPPATASADQAPAPTGQAAAPPSTLPVTGGVID